MNFSNIKGAMYCKIISQMPPITYNHVFGAPDTRTYITRALDKRNCIIEDIV